MDNSELIEACKRLLVRVVDAENEARKAGIITFAGEDIIFADNAIAAQEATQ